MALVRNFERIKLQSEKVHGDVDCTYTVFVSGEHKYFQIDTYGSRDRKLKGKKSQSFQIDEKAAKELFLLLKAEFSL